jgi:hypothetical protein
MAFVLYAWTVAPLQELLPSLLTSTSRLPFTMDTMTP